MEQPLTAHKDGTVTGLAVEVGQTVSVERGLSASSRTDHREQDPGDPGLGRQRAVRASAPGCRTGTGTGSGTS